RGGGNRSSHHGRPLRRSGQEEGRCGHQGEKAAQAQVAAPHAGPMVRLRWRHEGGRAIRLQPAGRRRGKVRGAAGQAQGRVLSADCETPDARRLLPKGRLMTDYVRPDDPILQPALWRLYRRFFDQAERWRRWSIEKDIPWDECNRNLDPVIADVAESFCAVELYMPDYLAHAMPWSQPSRAYAWFYANWGYEESKHSLALHDWLLKSGMCSEERMADLDGQIYQDPW